MNTTNVANNIANAAAAPPPPTAPASITMKTHQQPTALLHQQSGIPIPATIIAATSNETTRLNNSNSSNQTTTTNSISSISSHHPHQNHEPVTQQQQQSTVTAFTIHAPTAAAQSLQTIPNNLVSVAANAGAGQQAQIQTVAAANTTSIIHPVTITGITTAGSSSVVCTATILPTGAPGSGATGHHQQVTAIPVGSLPGPTVLKAQPTVATLPIGQRFQATNVAIGTSTGPPPNGTPINALFIHQDPASQKNQSNAIQQAHPTITPTSNHPQHQQQSHTIQQNPTTVINTNVSVAGLPGTTTVTLQPISSHSTSQHHTGSLFVQTGPNQNPNTNTTTQNSAIFHQTNVAHQIGHHPNSSSQQQPTNLSTINLSTSSVQQSQQAQPQQQQFQRLKVEDALSYLDQVKFKFNDKPQVYNDFLDIMKEFKSQSIDTPGVIQRVSNLFKGHPELIVGFNTFLPPGYKIEIHSNDQVNVSMPNSTNVVLMSNTQLPSYQQQQSSVATSGHAIVATGQNIHHQLQGNMVRGATLVSSNQNLHHGQSNHHPHGQQSFVNSIQPRGDSSASASSISSTTLHSNQSNSVSQNRIESASNHNHRYSGHMESNSRNSTAAIHSHHLSNQQNSIVPPSGPVEFNHAINYVNKIKNRFLDQPEIYKQFLDILQSYQKEQDNSGQKILTESEVFSKVSKLFENQPDLLQEFSQFLPDAHNSSGGGGSHSSHHHNQASSITSHHVNNAISSSASYSIQNSSNQALSSMNQYSHHHTTNLEHSGSNYTHQQSNQSIPVNHEQHNSMASKKAISVISSNSVLPNRTSTTNNTPNSFPNAFHRAPKRSISNNQIEQSNSQHVSVKRSKLAPFRESSIPDAGKYMGDLVEYAFFDKLRLALNSSYNYDTFLRCLVLFNNEIVNRSELAQLVHPLFSQCPDLYKRFKEMLNIKEGSLVMNSANVQNHNLYLNLYNNSYLNTLSNSSYHTNSYANSSIGHLEGLSNRIASFRDRRDHEYVEVDFTACKRYGVSYRTIPKASAKQECSGRTPLCREVLNDTLVSFPSWSEDSTFVSSRKTQYEEYVYRCEDERYELDHVIETNLSTIRVLESVQRKMDSMTPEEKSNFKLDDTFGGSSHVIHVNSIRRIYGENSASVIEGIKNSPSNVIPLVLRRLISKDEEWRDAQKQFNRTWREQNEKYYLKSLDHQGISFKQNDIKYLRSKSLLNEIENIVEERNDQQHRQQEDQDQPTQSPITIPNQEQQQSCQQQPHMIFVYPDKSMIDVACNLIIHHVKRQTSIHKEDKRKIKQLMRHFIPDLFATPRGELSDDEIEEDTKSEKTRNLLENIKNEKENHHILKNEKLEIKPQPMLNSNPDEEYSLFFVNNFWYLFFRLHYILCERLSKMHKRAQQIALEEVKDNQNKNSSPSILLRLRNNLNVKVEDYFSTLVDMIKQVLDGNLDSNQYEDNLREMFSIHAYIAFTLDKVVQNIVRQLQHIVGDEVSQHCTELYLDACKSGYAGGLCITSHQRAEDENLYQKNFEQVISEENRFKVIIYKGEGKVTIDMLESNEDEAEESTNEGDEDSNIPQSSRTLRSSTKNMSVKERRKCLLDSQKVNELLEEKLKTNPPFLRKYIRKHKGLSPFNMISNSDSNEPQSSNSPKQNEDKHSYKSPTTATTTTNNHTNNVDTTNNDESEKDTKNMENECKFNLRCFKSLLVVQNETVLYRKNISDKPKMSHKKISQTKYKRFDKWYANWIESNCSSQNKIKYEKWFLNSDTTDFKLDLPDNNEQDTVDENERQEKNDNIKTENNKFTSVELSNESSASKTPNKSLEETPENVALDSSRKATTTMTNEENVESQKQIVATITTTKTTLQRIKMDSDSVAPYRTYYKYLFKS